MQKKILDKYIMLYLSYMAIFYSYMVMFLSLMGCINYKRNNIYIGIIFLGFYFVKKLNIKIKEIQERKSIVFTLLTLVSALWMYLFFLHRLNREIFVYKNFLLFSIFIFFIIGEIIYYKKDIKYIKNSFKEKLF